MQSFDFDMFASIDSFCIDRVASAEVRLVLAVMLPCLLGVFSIVFAWFPNR